MPPCVFIIDFPGYQSHASIYPSIARADFSVCVRPSIRPLAPRRFIHPPDGSPAPPLPHARPVRPPFLSSSHHRYPSSRDPYPLVETTLAAIATATATATTTTVAAAAAAVVVVVFSAVPLITDKTREIP